MPRFTEEEMKEAVLRVTEEGFRVNRVARENGLCKKTLKSYVDKYLHNFGSNGAEVSFRPNYEINQVFTRQHEQIFEEHLISLDCAQRKITRDFVREEAYNFATMCNVHVPKTWNVRKQAGQDWMYGFLNRHPKVKSIIVRNKKNVQPYFQVVNIDVKNVIPIVDIHNMEDENCLSNDELISEENHPNECTMRDDVLEDLNTNDDCPSYSSKIIIKSPLDEFSENIRSAYAVVAEKDFVNAEQVYNLGEIALVVDDSLSKNGEQLLVTACCLFNAAGDHLPPFFVFPRKEWRSSVLEGLPEGVAGVGRPTGRLDDNAFSLVLEHFQRQTETIPASKKVFIMDVDEHHVTIDSLDFFQEHGIEVVTLPPHYGSNLQPAERYVFPTIRFLFNQCLRQLRARKRTHLTVNHIATLFCRIQKIAFSSDNIRKGFAESGIFPLNDELIAGEFVSRKINHYELTVSSTEISLDLPDAANDDEYEFLDEKESTSSPHSLSPLTEEVPSDGTSVEEFLNNLVEAYGELEAYGGIQPEKVYNVDEFEISIDDVLESNRSNRHISVCCYANAVGHALPPFLVYPEAEFSSTTLAGNILGMRGTSSADGRIDDAIFLQMLQHFQRYVNATLSNRVVLIMDCENYHISLKTIDFCEANGIILVTVPSHITGISQPLERTVFQTVFSVLQHQFAGAESETAILMSDVADLLAKTFESCFTSDSIVSGFKMSGLWPLDRDLIVSNSMWTECFDAIDDTDCDVLGEDSKSDEEDDGAYSDLPLSDSSSSMSDSEVDLFYRKIEDFLSDHSSDERLYVLGELRLATRGVVTDVKLFVNAVGTLLSPYLLYSTDADDVLLESSLGITCHRRDKNADDQSTLLMSVKHFREHSLVSRDCKMLLLLEDANCSRLTQTIREFGENNGIVFAPFPCKDFECLHPLENSFMKTLRQRFNETRYQLDSINDVIGFLEQACIELFESEEIATKFREYGMCSTSASIRPIVEDEEEQEKLSVANLNAYSNAADLKYYDHFIIEEEIDVAVDEEMSRSDSVHL